MADSPELLEDVALAAEHRPFVLDVYTRLFALTHYELLGVPRNADKGAIKRAYFHLARFIHPDRYFGKNLGSYKPKLDAIFARVTKAYQALSSPEERAAYDASLGTRGESPARPAAPSVPVDPVAEAKRKALFEAVKRRVEEAKAKAAPHIQAAERARAAGDVTAAAEAYRKALGFTPNDPALQAACAAAERIAADRRCEAHRRQAALAEREGRWQQAATSWKRVLEAKPDDSEARARLAAALARA